MRKRRSWGGAAVFLLALLAVAGSDVEGFLLYDSELLGEGSPAALNDVGQVVGKSHDGQGGLAATLWEARNGDPRYLLPGQRSWAYDINDLGGILVANSYTGRKLVLTDTGTIDATGVHGVALNNLLQVVGSGRIWEAGETRSIDGVSGRDINDAGQVAGFKGGAAVVWDNGVVTEVGLPEAFSSQAYGINEAGQAVGWAEVPPRAHHAFLWDGSASSDLGTLGGRDAVANAINDLVQIVGWSDTPAGDRHAVLWEDGAIADLNDLLTEPFPYTLVDAVDINNRGQIACRAEHASGGSWAVLLNPIPEPGALLLALGGAAAALRRRRSG